MVCAVFFVSCLPFFGFGLSVGWLHVYWLRGVVIVVVGLAVGSCGACPRGEAVVVVAVVLPEHLFLELPDPPFLRLSNLLYNRLDSLTQKFKALQVLIGFPKFAFYQKNRKFSDFLPSKIRLRLALILCSLRSLGL